MLVDLLLFTLTGIIAGVLAGLLGIGGGLVTVPALHFIFYLRDFPKEANMILAIGTSLAAMVFTAGASAWSHFLAKGIDWHLFNSLFPPVVIGSFFGAAIAHSIPGNILKLIFGASICVIGYRFIFLNARQHVPKTKTFRMTHVFAGFIIGVSSTILGIGGGILSVPYFTYVGTPIRAAISTSAALGFPIALVGAASFLYLGFDLHISEGSLGYVYLPAFFLIAGTSACFAPLGAKLAFATPTHFLKQIFGVILIGAGFSMIYFA